MQLLVDEIIETITYSLNPILPAFINGYTQGWGSGFGQKPDRGSAL